MRKELICHDIKFPHIIRNTELRDTFELGSSLLFIEFRSPNQHQVYTGELAVEIESLWYAQQRFPY